MSIFDLEHGLTIRKVNRDTAKAHRELLKVSKTLAATEVRIRKASEKLRAEICDRNLAAVSVDALNRNKVGIRGAALKKAGYASIKDLQGLKAAELKAIPGVGEEMAGKIQENLKRVIAEEKARAVLRLDENNRTLASEELLKEVFCYRKYLPIREKLKVAEIYYDKTLAPGIQQLKKETTLIKWLLTDEVKREWIGRDITEIGVAAGEQYLIAADEILSLQKALPKNLQKEVSAVDCWQDFKENSASYYSIIEAVNSEEELDDSEKKYDSDPCLDPKQVVEKVNRISLHTELLTAVLRTYQKFGAKYIINQKRVLLGDEMGLGKTVQAIAAMAHLCAMDAERILVVCPLGIMLNWVREIEKHSKLPVVAIHGYGRDEELEQWLAGNIIGVTTYETLAKLPFDRAEKIDMLVVDEAHQVKNPEAKRTKDVLKLAERSEYLLYMTGTPLENHVDEMKYLLRCVNPGVNTDVAGADDYSHAGNFRKAVMPVYLRRIREDVAQELPEKIEKEDWLILNEKEKEVYEETLQSDNLMAVRRLSWNVPVEHSSKAKRLLEICEEAKQEERKVLVFSFFRETLTMVRTMLGECCVGEINGSVSSETRQAILDDFFAAKPGSVLVCQVSAGGVGMNIQAASVVVFCEPQLKPSAENQAIARAYRMGQTRNVIVHRLLMDDTIDELLMQILHEKKQIFEDYAQKSLTAAEGMQVDATSVQEEKLMNQIEKEELSGEDVANTAKFLRQLILMERDRLGLKSFFEKDVL